MGSCEVNPENMVMEFVSAAAGFLNELVGKSVQKKKALVETDNGVHIDDCDSVLGSETQDSPPRTRLTTCRLSRMLEERPRRGRR